MVPVYCCYRSAVDLRWLRLFVRRQKYRQLEQNRRRLPERSLLGMSPLVYYHRWRKSKHTSALIYLHQHHCSLKYRIITDLTGSLISMQHILVLVNNFLVRVRLFAINFMFVVLVEWILLLYGVLFALYALLILLLYYFKVFYLSKINDDDQDNDGCIQCVPKSDGYSGVFRRGLVGVKTPHDLTDKQAYTAICNLFIS